MFQFQHCVLEVYFLGVHILSHFANNVAAFKSNLNLIRERQIAR